MINIRNLIILLLILLLIIIILINFIQDKLEKMAATDFYGNLGKIIHDILGAANKIYRDMADVGDHKKRAKYR